MIGPLNLCDESHDISLVHSDHVYVKVVKVVRNALGDCGFDSLVK